eukprot:scaffold65824_cov69-Phaeocystis_antarctica.AAC.1
MVEELLAAGDEAVRVDALSDLPAAPFDVQLRALVREAAAEAVAVDGDEGRQHRRLGGGHELHVHEARGVRAHVAHEEVGLAKQLELRRQREGSVLVEVSTELLQTTAATATPVRPSHIAVCARAGFDRDNWDALYANMAGRLAGAGPGRRGAPSTRACGTVRAGSRGTPS